MAAGGASNALMSRDLWRLACRLDIFRCLHFYYRCGVWDNGGKRREGGRDEEAGWFCTSDASCTHVTGVGCEDSEGNSQKGAEIDRQV